MGERLDSETLLKYRGKDVFSSETNFFLPRAEIFVQGKSKNGAFYRGEEAIEGRHVWR